MTCIFLQEKNLFSKGLVEGNNTWFEIIHARTRGVSIVQRHFAFPTSDCSHSQRHEKFEKFFNVPHIRFSPDQNIMPAKAIAIEYHEKIFEHLLAAT